MTTPTQRITSHGLQVATELYRFIEDRVLPGTGVASDKFWAGFDAIVADLAPKNIALLAERDRLQTELDGWHKAHPGPIADMPAYRAFLENIGYLVPQPAAVSRPSRRHAAVRVSPFPAKAQHPQLVPMAPPP